MAVAEVFRMDDFSPQAEQSPSLVIITPREDISLLTCCRGVTRAKPRSRIVPRSVISVITRQSPVVDDNDEKRFLRRTPFIMRARVS